MRFFGCFGVQSLPASRSFVEEKLACKPKLGERPRAALASAVEQGLTFHQKYAMIKY